MNKQTGNGRAIVTLRITIDDVIDRETANEYYKDAGIIAILDRIFETPADMIQNATSIKIMDAQIQWDDQMQPKEIHPSPFIDTQT